MGRPMLCWNTATSWGLFLNLIHKEAAKVRQYFSTRRVRACLVAELWNQLLQGFLLKGQTSVHLSKHIHRTTKQENMRNSVFGGKKEA